MNNISGFTFIYNALRAGIPIRESIKAVLPYVEELVVVDAGSNDGTRELLETLPVRILDAEWGTDGGVTLARLHGMHTECAHENIIHFEGDEVFDDRLIRRVVTNIRYHGIPTQSVLRLQVEQNFQRVRWWPEEVVRAFKKGTARKVGHTADIEGELTEGGYLWDVTNCFRDNFTDRVEQQAELRASTSTPKPEYRMVGIHANDGFQQFKYMEELITKLNEPVWTRKETPLRIPEILKPLLGRTKYE